MSINEKEIKTDFYPAIKFRLIRITRYAAI